MHFIRAKTKVILELTIFDTLLTLVVLYISLLFLNILKFLTKNKGKVYSINQIYESVWEDEAYGAENIIAVHIRHIREKIEINPKEPKYLKVIWGVGYKVENVTTGTELMVKKEVILK